MICGSIVLADSAIVVFGTLRVKQEKMLSKFPSLLQAVRLECRRNCPTKMSRVMRKPAFCISKNNDADQLHGTTPLFSLHR